MARLNKTIELQGEMLTVPQYVNRTISGWQVRIRGIPSQHFADRAYGGPRYSLQEASLFSQTLVARLVAEQHASLAEAPCYLVAIY